jgi:hypothetical protein
MASKAHKRPGRPRKVAPPDETTIAAIRRRLDVLPERQSYPAELALRAYERHRAAGLDVADAVGLVVEQPRFRSALIAADVRASFERLS